MIHLALVFCHFLAAALALGAIVATDLRLLSKLAQDRVRIAPPNAFVTRIVTVSLLILILTGAALVAQGSLAEPGYLSNPKLQAKIALVGLLTVNAFVLHRLTFPRLARGRRVARWHALDWAAVAGPVALSNSLWLFVAFLGIARAWNDTVPFAHVIAAAAMAYLLVQAFVCAILLIAGRPIDPASRRWTDVLRQALASIGDLGAPPRPAPGMAPRRRHDDPAEDSGDARASEIESAAESHGAARDAESGESGERLARAEDRPPLRLVTGARSGEARRRAGADRASR